MRLTVGKDGKATNPVVIKSVAPILDRAALAVVHKLPAFTPAEQAGEKVAVYMIITVQFMAK